MVRQDQLGLQDQMVNQELQERKAARARQAPRVFREIAEQSDLQVLREHPDLLVFQVPLVLPDLRDLLVVREQLVSLEAPGQLDPQDQQVLMETSDLMVCLE